MSRIRGQDRAAQIKRLDNGCCPVHGLDMGQISRWFAGADGRHFTVVACGRGDCDFIGKSYGPGGPVDEMSPAERAQIIALDPLIPRYLDYRRQRLEERQRTARHE